MFTHPASPLATLTPAAHQRRQLAGLLTGAAALALSGCGSTPPHTQPASASTGATQPPTPAMPTGTTVPLRPLHGSYAQRADVMAQVPDMARRLGLPENFVRNAIGNADFLPSVPRLILPAGKGVRRNWRVYRSRFIDAVRIRAGVQFWNENASALQRAEREFGVPAKYIVGIIGVETIYGRNVGNMRVIDTLATLSFDFPSEHPRAAERLRFFRNELEQYLQLTWNNHDDPTTLRGSYAGAMGFPQFMPSSWVKHAVDYDRDGHIDLFTSPTDAIGSVANYFKQYGWITGMAPEFPVVFDPARQQLAALLAPDIVPSFTPQQMAELGATAQGVPPGFAGKLALIELENGAASPSYYAGTQNFYVITRYNNSSYYAQSVIDLANEVERALR